MTIGSDVEFFVQDKATKQIKSTIPLFSCSKGDPEKFYAHNLTKLPFLLSKDNVSIEIAIPPANTFEQFDTFFEEAFSILKRQLDRFNLEIRPGNAEILPDSELQDAEAWIFGCDPDFDVYVLKHRRPPSLARLKKAGLKNLRSCGGHIHVGFEDKGIDKIALVRIMDYVLGRWSLDKEPALPRRNLYGKAGAMRFKPYGIEYRTLGNFWTTHKSLRKEVYSMVLHCLEVAKNPSSDEYKQIMLSLQETQFALNNGTQIKDHKLDLVA